MFAAALRADPEAGNLRFPVTPPSGCGSPDRATCRDLLARAVRSRPAGASASTPRLAVSMDASARAAALAAYAADTAGCVRCRLAETRTQVVFGSGQPGRGADDRRRGARATTRIRAGCRSPGRRASCSSGCSRGSGSRRDDVYLANVLKCRPPQNRDPLEAEIAACEPHLFRQIELVRPRVVATLGNFATKLLSGRSFGITRVHGQEHEVTLASTTVHPLPALPPGGGALHAVDAEGAGGRLRAAAGAARRAGRRARCSARRPAKPARTPLPTGPSATSSASPPATPSSSASSEP